MDDLISRRDAIDIVRCYYRKRIDRYCQKIETVDGTCYYRSEVKPYIENYKAISTALKGLPSAQPEITDEQAIEHLQSTGWMQNHDREMYDMGLKEQLADDSGSYDSLLPSAQPEPQWIPMSEREPEEGGHYLITARYEGDVIVVSDDYYSYGWDDWKDDVIAWAELPEPYKGGKDAD